MPDDRRRTFALMPNGNPVECPIAKGLPAESVGWCFEGDRRWRAMPDAAESGIAVRKPRKPRAKEVAT